MTRVFIGGSSRITRLEADVRRRLDRIVEKDLPVVVGDAHGADKAVQRYLSDRHFTKVEVFAADESPRNNVGGWPVRVVRPGHARKDFDYYATKDKAMAAVATVGLMLRLSSCSKPVVVYVQPKRRFIDVRTQGDLSALLTQLDRQSARRLHADAVAEGLGAGLADQAALGF